MINLLIAPIRSDLQISDTQISVIVGPAFALLYLGASLPFGRLADKHHRPRIIAFGCAFWSVATILCSLAESFWTLFFARMLVGVGEATLAPAAYSLLSDYFSKGRLSGALSVYSMGIWIGTGLALLLGGAVLNGLAGIGDVAIPLLGSLSEWQFAFLLAGLPGFVVALMVLRIPEPRQVIGSDNRPSKFSIQATSLKDTARYMRRHYRFYGAHYLGFGIFSLLAQAIVAWAPSLFIRTYHLSTGQAAMLLGALFLIFSVAGILVGGCWADRMLREGQTDAPLKVGAVGSLLLAPATIAAALAPNLLLGAVGAAAMCFFISFPLGVAASALQLVSPPRMRGQASAIYILSVGIIGIGLGPTIVALLTDHVFGYDDAIKYSLAATAAFAGPLGAILLISGRRQMGIMSESIST